MKYLDENYKNLSSKIRGTYLYSLTKDAPNKFTSSRVVLDRPHLNNSPTYTIRLELPSK